MLNDIKIYKLVYFLLIQFLILSSCLSHSSRGGNSVSDEWTESRPIAHGADPEFISGAIEKAGDHSFINSLLIVQNGYLIAEKYFNDKNINSPQNIKSVSKSIISALIGIALEEDFIDNVDQKVLDYFPEYLSEDVNREVKNITIKHLLTMSSGFDNNANTEIVLYNTPDWCKAILTLPMKATPGDEFAYSSANTHLLSAIITKAVGMNTMEFAKRYLFDKLKIFIEDWDMAPDGYYIGGSDIFLCPRDLAKLGCLYLNNGTFNNEQIIPAAWIKESLDYYHGSKDFLYNTESLYGYCWWLLNINDYEVHMALGFGGQMILVVHELDTVIVFTADENVSTKNSIEHTSTILNIISNYILTAPAYSP